MYRTLVRVGRSKFGQNFMPTMCCLATTVYGGVQFFLHDQLRDLLAAQSPSGRRERISDYLRHLIEETHELAVKHGFSADGFTQERMKFPPAKLKWFLSSTLEPVNFGTTKLKPGVLIGVPVFYNYSRPDDVPEEAFDIKKMSLLRSPQDSGLEEREKVKSEAHIVEQDKTKSTTVVRRIDRNSDEGREYMDSLLLSDNAKKFSIARELFLGDTYRPLLEVAIFFISCSLAVSVSRASVILLKTKNSHVTHRIPGYIISGLLGFGNYMLVTGSLDQYYAKCADAQAKDLGSEYVAGAEEYFAKRTQRNSILGINK